MELEQKIRERKAKIGIIGLGYVGLPLSLLFCKKGFIVEGFDIDKAKIEKLYGGISYLSSVSAEEIKEYIKTNLFKPTYDFSRLSQQDVIVICVPTPLGNYKEPDLSFIISTSKVISRNMGNGQLIILESTSYPGTTEEVVLPILKESNKKFYLGFSSERIDPGSNYPIDEIPKVVSGLDKKSLKLVSTLYKQVFKKTVEASSLRVAEASKLLENIYRSVNIALVNELKILFDKMGLNIWEIIEVAKTKPYGFQPFYPGPGLGGHCIPIDPFYLSWKAKEYGINTKFIELAGEINTQMPRYVVNKLIESLNKFEKKLKNSKILILGLAYKKDIDDIRESPALEIISLLLQYHAQVFYHDPYVPQIPKTRKYKLSMKSVKLEKNFLKKMDAAIIVTNHSNIDYEFVVKNVPLIIDTRNTTRNLLSKYRHKIIFA